MYVCAIVINVSIIKLNVIGWLQTMKLEVIANVRLGNRTDAIVIKKETTHASGTEKERVETFAILMLISVVGEFVLTKIQLKWNARKLT